MQLTDKKLKATLPKEKPYRISDGDGLYLLINPNGSKYFRHRYYFAKKRKEIHLGTYPDLSLKNARLLRNENKTLLNANIDPAIDKKKKEITKDVNNSNIFREIAKDWLSFKAATWSKDYHRAVESRMQRIVYPKIGEMTMTDLTPSFLYSVLDKIQKEFSVELAHKCKQYMGLVFTFAIPLDKAERNPINDLKGLLRPKTKKHYAAIIDPKALGVFLRATDKLRGSLIMSTAVKLTPQLLCRPGELRQLLWSDVKWDDHRIEIPAERMKMKTDHIIPMTTQCTELLRELYKLTGWQTNAHYVFPSQRGFSRPLSENGVRVAILSLGYDKEDVTPHGFRATARTLLDEIHEYPVEIIEQQLAHTVKDMNGRAYNRTKHLKQRSEMMQTWADYLDKLKEQVI